MTIAQSTGVDASALGYGAKASIASGIGKEKNWTNAEGWDKSEQVIKKDFTMNMIDVAIDNSHLKGDELVEKLGSELAQGTSNYSNAFNQVDSSEYNRKK